MISRRERTFNYVVLCLFAAFAVIPVVGVLSTSLARPQDAAGGLAWPTSFHLANFRNAWSQGHFSTYLGSSVLVTVSVVVLTGLLSILAGYGFATMPFPGRSTVFFVMLLGLMLPVEGFMIPLYFDLRRVGLTDSYWSLILPQTAQSLAFGIFWMRNYFRSLPVSMLEAARIDGASERAVLWQVLVPPGRPAIVSMSVLVAMWTWNEFLLPLIMISGESRRTAPLGLTFFQGQHTTEFALLAAAASIVALPIVVLYLVLQRRFIAGMLSGAVKG